LPKFIGAALPRLEDKRLITGSGRYTDDVRAAGSAHAAFIRSPYAHARIGTIDASAALAAPGVIAVLTAADYLADGHRAIAHVPNPADAVEWQRPGFVAPEGEPPVADIPQLPLAYDRARHAGEAVAVVIAETAAQARDAIELVEIAYEALRAVVSAVDALEPDAPAIWDQAPGNRCFDLAFGDEAANEAAFARAHLVVERTFDNHRIVTCHMEPRAAIASYDAASGDYTVVAGSQGVFKYRVSIAQALGVDAKHVHVSSPDVGGGFGSRTNLHPEPLVLAWAAKRLGRTVRWTSDRSESFVTDFQGRDITDNVALAFDARGRLLAMRATMTGNMGAYTVGYAPLQNAYRIATGVYDIPLAFVRARGAITNTTPTAPFRGAGRPEATHAIERLLDIAASELGLDRIEIRRRNIVRTSQLPYRTAVGLTLDSGDFVDNMERALVHADWAGFEARRTASLEHDKLRGIGFANYVEAPVGAPRERLILTVRSEGVVEIATGTQSTGQGHETTFAQVAAELLDVPIESIKLVQGESRAITIGGGTHSNRSMRIVGTLLVETCGKLRERAGVIAAAHPDAAGDMFAIAAIAERDGEPLTAEADFAGRIPAHPTGCAVCELEIDPATGVVTIERYSQVDDVGQAINPLILDGQTHGGIAMGIGQTLYEQLFFDRESGQVRGGTFMEYAVPRSFQVPHYDVELREHPTAGNPLRVKGGGEGGVTPAPAAIINAICDALRDYGVDHVETPATPEKIWRAMHASCHPELVEGQPLSLSLSGGPPTSSG
jgi:aerobic carbon-monoxide dehydrogenase large subunit